MTGWRLTGALVRATAVVAVLTLAALAFGRPDLLVLAAPFGLFSALAMAYAPRRPLVARSSLADRWLHEGQSTRLRIEVGPPEQVEQMTATLVPPAFVVTQPASGMASVTAPGTDEPRLEFAISPRRWGRHPAGSGLVAATSRWGGQRWGPQPLPEHQLTVLPGRVTFSSTESPHPVGLIGQNRSRRGGDGTEFWEVRPFQPGDRLRRVNWRTTLRTGKVHAVGTTAQEDSAVLLLLDAVADLGTSGGIDGEASSLDLSVRAANAIAAHHIRVGDRVALRVLGRHNLVLGPGSGVHHQRRLQELLAQVQPGRPDFLDGKHLRFPVVGGTVVVVLSPLLTPEITTAMVTMSRRGLTLVAVDTLPAGAAPEPARVVGSAGALAWRMRLVERQVELTELSRQGIPVVTWRGPGTLDEVLRRLARRARLPREVSR